MTVKVLTANRVGDGLVVFFTSGGEWDVDISEALAAGDQASVSALNAELERCAASTEVTDAYVFDAEWSRGALRPVHIRDRIRSLGPTVRHDLGKQSAGVGGVFAAVG